MRLLVKIGIVAGGYVAAFFAASAVVAIHVVATNGSDRQGASGMYAFGDRLFFLAAFGAASVPATAAALFFLRPFPRFWKALSFLALVVAFTGFLAMANYLAARHLGAGSPLQAWAAFAVLRILASPLFAGAFLICGLLAPERRSRTALLAATAAEAVVFGYIAIFWFLASRSY